jgi:glycosyltransferase involved in cell wall biosynthesis
LQNVLYVSHNHPAHRIGGGEVYAHELYRAVRGGGQFNATFISKAGPPFSDDGPREETRFGLLSDEEYFFYTHQGEFDGVLETARHKRLYTDDWRTFLTTLSPDLVHFQHSLFLGYDMIRETRRTLPEVPIVYSFHEFKSICHHGGKMVRTRNNELCYEASPRRCNQCFPDISAQMFFLRERFIKSAFELVDMFIVPSRHARERYVDWGIPPARIQHIPHGRLPVAPIPDPPDAGSRNRIGFLGQVTRFKGVELLLEAMKILGRQGSKVQLSLHGGNLNHQPEEYRNKIDELLAETEDNVVFFGPYAQTELPELLSAIDWLVVPSIWWETGPLVIHEALAHNRPVICSDIGSMVEHIQHEVNGLHFRVGDAYSLADAIERAARTPELWHQLRAGITPPTSMDEHLAGVYEIYRGLLDGPSATSARAVAEARA